MKAKTWLVRSTFMAGLLPVVVATGCQPLDTAPATVQVAAELEHQPTYVDSIFPIEEEIRRFRAQVGTRAERLADGASSRDELVRTFIDALEAEDRAAIGRLALTPAEFIDLYYPHTRFTRRPYEMAPQLVWYQLENYGSKGLSRALDRFGGRDLDFRGYACETAAVEGPNRVAGGCVVDVLNIRGERVTTSLFGQIIEHGGVYKFINFANGL
jgi:hypothetical protein